VHAADVLLDLTEHLAVAEARKTRRTQTRAQLTRDFVRELAIRIPCEEAQALNRHASPSQI